MYRNLSRRELLKRSGGLAVACLGARYGLRPAAAWAAAEETVLPQILEGDVPPKQRLQLETRLARAGIEYAYKRLPDESATYDGYLYRVVPCTIWWHWDGGPTPTAKQKDRVYGTYNGLAGRTRRGDPVAVQFCAGPGKVLQMLPVSPTHIVQGRLTDDAQTQDVRRALSLGGIQIETPGIHYVRRPPSELQTDTLLRLTQLLMRQYQIPFSGVLGHLERSPRVRKVDPGFKYLKGTRIRLLKRLIAAGDFHLIGPPEGWRFHKLVDTGKKVVKLNTQTPAEILRALTPAERQAVRVHFVGAVPPESTM